VSLGTKLSQLSGSAVQSAWSHQGPVEAFSPQPENTVDVFTEKNLLAEAVHRAFYKHYPLILSPDIIWLAIAQGFANHVNQDPEVVRKQFVDFKGKETISISRPGFVKGSPLNDWPSVFPEFAEAIGGFIGKDAVEMVTCNFSTSGPTERIVSQITLMDTVQHYFEYSMECGCGIPSIGLRGTVEDWKSIRAKAEKLQRFGLEWWLKELLPVLDQFVNAAQEKQDTKFWRAICNFSGASGFNGAPISGWLQVFFPYLNASGASSYRSFSSKDSKSKGAKIKRKLRQNSGIGQYWKSYKSGVTAATYERNGFGDTGCGYGIELDDIPPSISSAPFKYIDHLTNKTYNMAFMGGIVSLVQHNESLALEPKMGWAVIG